MHPGPVQAGEHGFFFPLAVKICYSLEGGRTPENFVSPEEKKRDHLGLNLRSQGQYGLTISQADLFSIFFHNSDFLGLELWHTNILEHRTVSISMDLNVMNQSLLGVSKYLKGGCRDGDSLFIGSHMEKMRGDRYKLFLGSLQLHTRGTFISVRAISTGIKLLREVVDSQHWTFL